MIGPQTGGARVEKYVARTKSDGLLIAENGQSRKLGLRRSANKLDLKAISLLVVSYILFDVHCTEDQRSGIEHLARFHLLKTATARRAQSLRCDLKAS
jgi:hypothetical protein